MRVPRTASVIFLMVIGTVTFPAPPDPAAERAASEARPARAAER
jgi:hypothetical protein